jgi:hypothetical protein
MGLSYIKIYDGLSREVYLAIAHDCRKRGLQMVGHIPDRIGAKRGGASRAGIRRTSGRHTAGLLPKGAEARWMVQHNQNVWKMLLDTFDSAKADMQIESFRAGGVWQTPRLGIYRIPSLAERHKLPGDAPIQYARRDYLKAWPREALGGPMGGLDADTVRRLFTVYKDLVRRMEQRGVRILAGTNTPCPYCVPGFALHEELALLAEARLVANGGAANGDVESGEVFACESGLLFSGTGESGRPLGVGRQSVDSNRQHDTHSGGDAKGPPDRGRCTPFNARRGTGRSGKERGCDGALIHPPGREL